jgi:hypothetical protein
VKTCSRCKEKWPLSDFATRKNTNDGLQYNCRRCQSEARRLRVAAARDRVISRDGSKTCSLCNDTRPLVEFGECTVARDGHQSACKPCAAARARRYRQAKTPEQKKEANRRHYKKWGARIKVLTKAWATKNPERARAINNRTQRVSRWHVRLAWQCRNSAERRGHEFDLNPDFILELFEKQERRCHWLGIEMMPSIGTRDPLRPSIDRLDPDRGYTRDNVVLTSQFANMGRSVMTVEQMRNFVEKLRIHFTSMQPALRG